MKKAISLVLALVLCIGLCACSKEAAVDTPTAKKLSVSEVKTALDGNGWQLDIQSAGDQVTRFTVTISSINAENLLDKSYARNAINHLLQGVARPQEYQVCMGILPVMQVISIFDKTSQETDAFYEKVLSVICDGKVLEYDGWSISSSVNQSTDSITITATTSK